MQSTAAVFDQNAALAHVDGDVFILKDLATMLIDRYPDMVAKIEASIQRRDAESLYRAAHTLEGSLTTFFAQPAIAVTKSLQSICETEKWDEALGLVASLNAELQRLVKELQSLTEDSPRQSS